MPDQDQASGGASSGRRVAINPPVFFSAAGALVVFLVYGSVFPESAQRVLPAALEAVTQYWGWFYVLSVSFFLGFCGWLLVSRHARVKLGPDDAEPDYSTPSWFAMLFSAGMGIGLLFYGVAQPIMMYTKPPTGAPRTLQAAQDALPLTFFHWGLHAWAIYVVMGLAIAYFSYRKNLPLALRSTFHPLLGDRVHGAAGHVIDILAVFGTLFGLATSLGLGAMQINAGLHHLFDVPMGRGTQLALIAVITAVATLSLVTGVDKGIRRLSEANMILAAALLVFVFIAGPSLFILESFPENVGFYLRDLVDRSFRVGAIEAGEWNKAWTLFYWGWWIAWAPFVGMFVARISRGRTIGEFVSGVLLVPTLVTFIWLTVFGDTALWLELHGGGGVSEAVAADVSTALYVVLQRLPLSSVTCFLAALVVAVFFVTSSDSASFVVDMLTSGGDPDPPIWQRVFWAVAEGATAAVLLVTAGKAGLSALQSAVVCIGAPFALVMVLMCVSLLKALRDDPGPAS